MIWWAAAVHTLTALGAVCALGATLAIFNHSAEVMFGWLGAALFIDGIDGVFARAIKVSERLPRFSGERLDLVVDYLTYVFVPVLALLNWHYLDGTFGRGDSRASGHIEGPRRRRIERNHARRIGIGKRARLHPDCNRCKRRDR